MAVPPHEIQELLDSTRVGFAALDVAPPIQERALQNLERWLTEPMFAPYRAQTQAMIAAGRWALLLDCFYQVLPFGTGGRRGPVGIGPNRYNTFTLASSVQGHATFLRARRGDDDLSVVIAYDVREFKDTRGELEPNVPSPVLGLTSRAFAELAAEVYAAQDITVWLPADDTYVSTPELSFSIRHLGADGGLNISASHNPPDDNGGKFYNATGAQEVPPRDEEMAQLVEAVTHIERMPIDRARAAGLVKVIGPEVHRAYLDTNLRLSVNPQARSAHVVFTGLHGTGRTTVADVLHEAGFTIDVEPTQAAFDGQFPNVPFRVPNPEVPQSMERACSYADEVGGDIVMACDPDADRLGLMAKHPLGSSSGEWRFFTGNEIACLTASYLLTAKPRGERDPLVIKTEVTSRLLERVARLHGARVVGHLLVGFKYIGDALERIETHGRFSGLDATLDDFLLGAEESHGVLVTPAIRDKDAAGAALLLAELASEEKAKGRTLVDSLREIWRQVGYVRNDLRNTVMRGAEGRNRIQLIQARLREDPPSEIAGYAVTAFHDRQDPAGPFGEIVSETDRASRDTLVWELGDEARILLRPSGTEPKNKIYVEVCGQKGANLSDEIPRINQKARQLGDAFLDRMLRLVDIELPPWAFAVSDLVAVEHKIHFAGTLVPELLGKLDDPNVEAWLDAQLKPYGKDARGLVAPAVQAYVAAVGPPSASRLLELFRSRG
jgi:phosphoglucomutase/phosphomannomutase